MCIALKKLFNYLAKIKNVILGTVNFKLLQCFPGTTKNLNEQIFDNNTFPRNIEHLCNNMYNNRTGLVRK